MDIKNTRFTVLLIILGIASVLFAASIPDPQWNPGYDHGAARQADTYTKSEIASIAAELETLLQVGNLVLYYRTATDTITGGRLLSTTTEVATSSIAYAALSATTYTQVNALPRLSITTEPAVATLPKGLILTTRYMSLDQDVSTNRRVMGVNELWMVDADGSSNPTFIASSSEYTLWGTAVQRVEADYSLATDTATGGTTRRFLEKHFRKRSGNLTGADPIVTVYYGGIYEGILSLSLPSAIVMRADGTNADSPVFPGPVTVMGQFTASDGAEFNGVTSAVKILGNPTRSIGNTATSGNYGLDIWNGGCGILLGAEERSNMRTSGQPKYGRILCPSFTNSEESWVMLAAESSNGDYSVLKIGGGLADLNACTTLEFRTAPNANTLGGPERARINNSGQLLIATTTAAIDSAVKLKLNGGMEISPGGFAVIGSDTRMAGYDLTVASGAYLANVVATGTLKIPLVAPADPQPGMLWFEP